MQFYDLTLPVSEEMPVWPGDEPPRFHFLSRLIDGETTNTGAFRSSLHLGTHVDAPRHLFADAPGVDALPLDVLMGPAAVVVIPQVRKISREVLEKIPWPVEKRVLFKTENSLAGNHAEKFQPDFVSLTADGAQFLVEKGTLLVGIDAPSIDLFSATKLPAHKILLGHGVVVVENLVLQEVPSGIFDFCCLPLKILNADGAPARAVLREIRLSP